MDKTIKKGYKQTDIGVIPDDWKVKNLEEVSERVSVGLATSVTKYYRNKGIPIIRNLNIKDGFFDDSDMLYLDEDFAKANLSKSAKGLDVLTVHTGANLGLTCVLPKSYDKCQTFTTLITTPQKWIMNSYYLCYHMNSFFGKKEMKKLEVGGGKGNLNTADLKKYRVFFPPTNEEQTAIANILSDTDALIERLGKLIAKKKAIKQGTMQQLLTGKKRLPGFSGEWELKNLGEIGETYGGLSGKKKGDFDRGKYPYIPFMNIMSNPVIDLQYFDYVNIRSDEKQNKAIKGDLFFNGSSETPEEVGMCSVLQGDIPNLYLNSFCFGFRLNKDFKTDGLYLSYFFRSPMGRQLIFSLAQGATRYNLSKINFMKLEIPYPDPAEQTAIATILSDMDAEIESLEQKRDKYTMLKQGMMQQLLTGRIRIYANN